MPARGCPDGGCGSSCPPAPAELARPDEPMRVWCCAPTSGACGPLFDTLAERLAEENGWASCRPEPLPGREDLPLEERLASVGDFDDLAGWPTLVQAADATGMHTVGVLGFCMGGMWALKASATGRFHRAVSFYGMIRMPEQWRSDTHGRATRRSPPRPARARCSIWCGTIDPYVPLDRRRRAAGRRRRGRDLRGRRPRLRARSRPGRPTGPTTQPTRGPAPSPSSTSPDRAAGLTPARSVLVRPAYLGGRHLGQERRRQSGCRASSALASWRMAR